MPLQEIELNLPPLSGGLDSDILSKTRGLKERKIIVENLGSHYLNQMIIWISCIPDRMHSKGHSITSVEFLPKMHNLNVTRKPQFLSKVSMSGKKVKGTATH